MVLVYDLGGGTFDITMIEIKERLIRVICTGGDHRLGGVLWDEAIVMYLAEQFRTQTGEASDPLDDPEVLNDLFLQAERGKKTLTQRDKAPFRVTHAGKPGPGRARPRASSRRSPSTCSTGPSS